MKDGIDAVSAGEMFEQKLSDTGELGGSEKHYDVVDQPLTSSMRLNVRPRCGMLDDFQEPSQRCRSNPVPTPVNKTASQKRTASGDWSVEGMMLPAVVG
jgi:hypothetical protein